MCLLTLLLKDCRSCSSGNTEQERSFHSRDVRAMKEHWEVTVRARQRWIFAIPQRTAHLSRPWHQLSNAVSTVTVIVSVEQDKEATLRRASKGASWEVRLASPTSLVALLWILFIGSRWPSAAPAQMWEQYSKWGLTRLL